MKSGSWGRKVRRSVGRRIVPALVLALIVPTAGQVQVAEAKGLGRPDLPKQEVTKVKPMTGLGAKAARDRVAAARTANAGQADTARAQQRASWPKQASATARIAEAEGKAARVDVGGLPVTITAAAGHTAPGTTRFAVQSRAKTQAAGIKGVLLAATGDQPGTAKVGIDYAQFASAYGGGWSGRLRLFQLPACVLTTPEQAACRTRTPLASHNDIGAHTVTANTLVGSTATTVLALAATSGASASGSGDYTASPLTPSSTWNAGSSSGAFTWSSDLTMPPAAAGPAPKISLSYDSGSIDGRTASTNNQTSQVGEGFDISAFSYIERSYGSCDKDGQKDKFDLCWKYDNASLVLNGSSTELVKDDTTGTWRLKNDDASTVTHSTGADNGDDGADGGNDKGEYWTITTGDGTQYVFGKNKLPGAGATDATNSTWTVPVYGDDSGEPGYSQGDAFSDRSVTQAWRWNLDYVVDLHGNAMSYWYTPETNYYAKNGATTATAKYTRGGYLNKILYGQQKDTLFTGAPPSDQVIFTYAERCTAADCTELKDSTADHWPDVPFDSICASGADCDATGPAFFTRKRLTNVTTQAWFESGLNSTFTDVDSWDLTQEFLDGGDIGDTTDQTLTLKSLRHTGKNGTAIALDPVTFTYEMRPNRVDAPTDDILPLTRPRMRTVTSETGAITNVTMSQPECVRGSNMPAAEDDNNKACYPQFWNINGAQDASLDWFNKYRVVAVNTGDPSGFGENTESAYSYSDPAWHYNDNPLVPEDERTWSEWRGYGKVTVTKGVSGATQSKTVSLYLQGMDGDKLKGTTATRPVSVKGIDFTGLDVADQTDSEQYAGSLRERITYNGSTPVTVTVNDPWSRRTATQHKSYADTEAYFVNTQKTFTHTYLTAKNTWRTRATSTPEFDEYGKPVKEYDEGDTAVTGDETCTRTWYAANTTLGIHSLTTRTRTVGRACSTAETDLSLPTDFKTRGDVLSDAATVYDGPATTTAWTAAQTPTLGEATWTGRASAYPASATGGERNPTTWQTTSHTDYDDMGRIVDVSDTAGNKTTTAYTPTNAGPLTKTKVTNAKTQSTFTYTDYARGLPVKVYDANNKVTETTYDALGRTTATWLPNRSHSANDAATYTYAYSVTNTAAPWSSVSVLKADGTTYNTSYTIYDSLLRTLQTQTPTPAGGRLLTDTRYNSRGLAYETFADLFDTTKTPNGTYTRAEYGHTPKQSEIVFDGAERPTSSTFLVSGVTKWSTTTTYTGDSTAVSAVDGGSATRTIVDALGRTTETREYTGTSPADTGYGATVGAAYTSVKYTYTRDGKQNTVTGPDSTAWSYTYDLFGRQISATDPDKGTTSTGYTSLDQVSWTKDTFGRVNISAYDVLGRPTGTWWAQGTAIADLDSTEEEKVDANKLTAYTYDTAAKGQLDTATRYVGGVSGSAYTRKVTAYDSLYHPTSTQLVLPSSDPLVTSKAVPATLTTTAYYNIDGTQQAYGEPAAGGLPSEQVETKYNGLGLPNSISGTSGYLQSVSYSAQAQPQLLTLGTSAAAGTKNAYLTNLYEGGTDRLIQASVVDDVHSYELQELNYKYDDAGNVTSITDPTVRGGTGKVDNQCFTYDGHSRLTDAWTPATPDCATSGRTTANLGGAGPYWTSYTYKDSGLRATETAHTASTTTTKTYCYDSSKIHRLIATTTGSTCTGATSAYVYDSTGNTTTRPDGSATQTLTWSQEGRLDTLKEGTSTTGYIYDADGNLLIRRNTTGETVLYLGTTEVHLDTSGTTAKYWAQRYYTGAGSTIALRSNKTGTNTLTWLGADHHGTSSIAIDATTQATTKRYTTPFGAPRAGGTGTWPDDKAFLGATADPASGLTHLGVREYDPTTGRFISVDPLLTLNQHQSLNGYTYANNNPATLSDPTGEKVDNCAYYRDCTANGGDRDDRTGRSDGKPKGDNDGTADTDSTGHDDSSTGGDDGDWLSDFGSALSGKTIQAVTGLVETPVQAFTSGWECVFANERCGESLMSGIATSPSGQSMAMAQESITIYGDYRDGKSAEATAGVVFNLALLATTRGEGAGVGSAGLEASLFRRGANTGAFADLKVPMQKRVVKQVAKKAGVGLDGVPVKINRDMDLIGRDLYGHTTPDGRITLYPDAFSSMENLVKTLGHERMHVMQTRVYGPASSLEQEGAWERAAYGSEGQFWNFYNGKTG
ncbi:RHS repeat-associated core domain-containing protein [Streptomyces sp. MI02-7b]|uniref:RHS repeat-associated core domain-containing protein n=1 Tax=Streptomyces sp. MI02-7b TaxID=462941 RepID=UPI0029B55688|nr:RHS repeat-associated core domain-containing protein [Streptomyces sp. MI02-7b]MDX3075893.1 RHS repeat-associated core domain-containing protein [Streptomyces sp. MI02-7b]